MANIHVGVHHFHSTADKNLAEFICGEEMVPCLIPSVGLVVAVATRQLTEPLGVFFESLVDA